MMVPNYSSKEDWNTYNALGVTQYGQMTAGSFMYIGPQGIVHGTTITLMNAGRLMHYGSDGLKGRLFVTSGLGGMSGAQAIAAVITGVSCIIAEVDKHAVRQRVTDGYIQKELVFTDLEALVKTACAKRDEGKAETLVYQGNVVDLWEYLVEHEIQVDLGSDQTSLHNIDGLGYCPVGYDFDAAQELLVTDKPAFLNAVRHTLQRHVAALNALTSNGMFFWDYGTAFLKEAGEAAADIWRDRESGTYRYPSYVENIMGPMCFDYGFGPFRWVCTSGSEATTDEATSFVDAPPFGAPLGDAVTEVDG
jgi:urocanate hydratase